MNIKKGLAASLCSLLLLTAGCDNMQPINNKTVASQETTNETTKMVSDTFNKTVNSNIVSITVISGPMTLDLYNSSAKTKMSYFEIIVRDNNIFSTNDLEFVSENPNIATIEVDSLSGTYLSCKVTGKAKGSTNVYIKAKDGSIESSKIAIFVINTKPTPKPTSKSKKKTSNNKTSNKKKNKNPKQIEPSQNTELPKIIEFRSFTYTGSSVSGLLKEAAQHVTLQSCGHASCVGGPGISYQYKKGTHYLIWKVQGEPNQFKQKVTIK